MRVHGAMYIVVAVVSAAGGSRWGASAEARDRPGVPPVGVSPGSAASFVPAAGPCPTFSWTSVAGAGGYELVVYLVNDETTEPRLEAHLPAGASSWTPAADRCLAPGGRYGWSVRAVTDRVRGEWSEALLFEVAVPPAEFAAALDVLRSYLGADALAAALEAARTAGPEASASAEDQTGLPLTRNDGDAAQQGAGADAIAVLGDVPGGSGVNFGVAGTSHSPDGAGVSAENTAGPDLSLAGTPPAEFSETAFSRDSVSNLTFDFSNPGPGSMTLQVEGAGVATDATVFPTVLANDGAGSTLDADFLDGLNSTAFISSATDDWVNETGDSMTGLLSVDVASGFALQTAAGDSIDVGGDFFKSGGRILHTSGGAGNLAVGPSALAAVTTGAGNTAVGANALDVATTGSSNVAVGRDALGASTTAANNIAVGDFALRNDTTGNNNVAVGRRAMYANTTASKNTALGAYALDANTTGFYNVAIGANALKANTIGVNNTAVGAGALEANTGLYGHRNTAIGYRALFANTGGYQNTAIGAQALVANTTGRYNIANGARALLSNTTGEANIAVGFEALALNTTGSSNLAFGFQTLLSNSTGVANVASGANAMYFGTTGNYNVAVGSSALLNIRSGSRNIALGRQAGMNTYHGNDNIFVGHTGFYGDANVIRLGTPGTHLTIGIAGIRGVTTGIANAIPVLIDSSGQLGTASSSRRVKTDIHDIGEASDRLLALRPVAFRYQQHVEAGQDAVEYGLIAEEVAEVFPELVVYDGEGRPETIKYQLLSTLLLNELQRESAELAALRERVVALEKPHHEGRPSPALLQRALDEEGVR